MGKFVVWDPSFPRTECLASYPSSVKWCKNTTTGIIYPTLLDTPDPNQAQLAVWLPGA